MKNSLTRILLISLMGCNAGEIAKPADEPEAGFVVTAILESKDLDEVSGIQSGEGGLFFLHNDEGKPSVYIADSQGHHLGKPAISEAKNRNWEDITRVPGENGPLLVLGDIGDNLSRHKSIKLYFVTQPRPMADGTYAKKIDLLHKLELRYPDGARDCEAMAYDSVSKMLLFLSKRDRPPRRPLE